MEKINLKKICVALNKTVFTKNFWEGADLLFEKSCFVAKAEARKIFGLRVSGDCIPLYLNDIGIGVNDSQIGHRAKRSILRKVGRLLRDEYCIKTKLGEADEYLSWKDNYDFDEVASIINEAKLEYLGWDIYVNW